MQLSIDPEFQSLIPPLAADEYAQLEANLLADGCRDPLVIWDGVIVDGHNRYRICQQHGIPFAVTEKTFASREDAIIWIVNNQLGRRNLTDYERGRLALRGKDALAAKARERKLAALKQGDEMPVGANLPPRDEGGKVREELAAAVGISDGSMAAIARVEASAPDVIKDKARRGELSIHRADVLTKTLKDAPEDVKEAVARFEVDDLETIRLFIEGSRSKADWWADIRNSGYVQVSDEDEAVAWSEGVLALRKAIALKAKQAARIANEARIESAHESARRQAVEDVYSVIYADPPWEYENSGIGAAAAKQYLTMPTSQICELLTSQDVKVTDNAVLFLWATNPLLPDALRVIEAWGFIYKTNMVWIKGRGTGGFYVNGGHELLLIATRGSMRPGVIPSSVISHPAAAHSQKPTDMYELIESMYPDQRYIEFFARRQPPRRLWTFWGNEAEATL